MLEDLNAEKQSDHQKKKFFINKSIEALIPLKEGYQGLLELHVPLGVFQQGGEMGLSPKSKFFLKQKNNV